MVIVRIAILLSGTDYFQQIYEIYSVGGSQTPSSLDPTNTTNLTVSYVIAPPDCNFIEKPKSWCWYDGFRTNEKYSANSENFKIDTTRTFRRVQERYPATQRRKQKRRLYLQRLA